MSAMSDYAYELEQQANDDMADYEHYTMMDTKPKGMRRLLTKEALKAAAELAKKDHPFVRHIQNSTYGVRCSKKCSHSQEHIIHFEIENGHVFSTCEGCSMDLWERTGDQVCRHVAASYALFSWVRKVGL